MRCVCLAGGRGKRMRPLTDYIAKPMLPVGMKPFLEYTLREAKSSGVVEEVVVVVGWKGEQIRSYFGTNFDGLCITYIEQPRPLGTGDALYTAHCAFRFSEPVVVWLGDVWVSAEHFRKLAGGEHNMLTLSHHICPRDHARVEVRGGYVTKAWRGESEYADIGCWRLKPSVLDVVGVNRGEGEIRVLQAVQALMNSTGEPVEWLEHPWIHLGDEPDALTNFLEVQSFLLERRV